MTWRFCFLTALFCPLGAQLNALIVLFHGVMLSCFPREPIPDRVDVLTGRMQSAEIVDSTPVRHRVGTHF